MRPSPSWTLLFGPGDGGSERCVQCGKLHAALRKLSRFRLTDVTSGGLSPQFRAFVGMSSSVQEEEPPPGAVAKMAVQSIAGRFQVNVTSPRT